METVVLILTLILLVLWGILVVAPNAWHHRYRSRADGTLGEDGSRACAHAHNTCCCLCCTRADDCLGDEADAGDEDDTDGEPWEDPS